MLHKKMHVYRVHRQLLTLFTRGLEQEDDNDSHSL